MSVDRPGLIVGTATIRFEIAYPGNEGSETVIANELREQFCKLSTKWPDAYTHFIAANIEVIVGPNDA